VVNEFVELGEAQDRIKPFLPITSSSAVRKMRPIMLG